MKAKHIGQRVIHHPIKGHKITLKALAEEYELTVETLHGRVVSGKTGIELVEPTIKKGETPAQRRARMEAIRRESLAVWMKTPAGRLSTRLLRDVGAE